MLATTGGEYGQDLPGGGYSTGLEVSSWSMPADTRSQGDPSTRRRKRERLNKTQKFVRLLEMLQTPGGVPAAELMAELDLDDRTFRRYMVDLKKLDIPVRSVGRGAGRRISVAPRYQREGVQLSLLELVSLRFGRSVFDFLTGTGFAQDMDDALETLSTLAIGAPGIHLAHDLDRKFIAVPEHRKDHTRDAEIIEDILTALLYQNPAQGHYAKVGGPTRTYDLHPLTLAIFRQGLYLFALDLEVDRVKTFAVDRFRHFERARTDHFEYPEDFDPYELVRDAFGIIGGPVQDVVLRFNRRATPYIRERIWHDSQVLEGADDGGAILRMRVGVAHELTSWVMGFGPDVEVLEPPELAARVRQLHWEAVQGPPATAREAAERAGTTPGPGEE